MNILELDSYKLADAVKFNKELNPRIWQSNKMRPEVRAKLLEIAEDFKEFLGLTDLEIKDIVVSGSNASYTYTPHSDIDLHIVADIPQADMDDVYRELFDAKKYQYNDLHDIKIGGYDVELYVENANKPAVSQGNYSLLRDDWNSIPKQRRSTVDDDAVRSKYEDLKHRIDAAVEGNDPDTINTLAQKIKSMRQSGLDQHGELGPENLAYKILRTQGYIKRLYDARSAARDAELSLPEQQRPVTYGFRSQVDEVGLTPDGVNPTTCMIVNEKESMTDQEMVEDFVKYCAQELGLETLPGIKLRRDPEWSVRNKTFGRYIDDLNRLEVGTANRHIMDILRTVAHELVHRHQHETQAVPADAGRTGSPQENEANARAGVLMRGYAEQHPDYFEHDALAESASGYIPTKRQAHDPRYEMALTQDIRPGQIGKEANKLKLKTNSQGQPQIANPNGLVESLGQELAQFKLDVLVEEEILDEVAMSPTALRDWARSPEAQGIVAGFEAELIFRGLAGGDDEDSEPDYEQDESASSISDIQDFFRDGEYNSNREVERLGQRLQEDYLDWKNEREQQEWGSVGDRQIKEWVRNNYNPDNGDASDAVAEDNPDMDPDSDEFREAVEQRVNSMMAAQIDDALMDPANPYHEEALDDWREDYYNEDQEEDWLLDAGLDSMSAIENSYNITWPHWTTGDRSSEDIGADLEQVVGMPVKVSDNYGTAKREPGVWIVEPDGSIKPDDGGGGREIVSPPMPLDQALAKLNDVINWANDPNQGNAYTNSSTGLHMGVSIPDKGGDVDYTKLVLFMGDQYVLQKFGREANTFCQSVLKAMKTNIGTTTEPIDPESALKFLRQGVMDIAGAFVKGNVGVNKYTSAHIKPGYIEFRSPGGDYLAEVNVDMDVLDSTMLRFARAMQIAGNPDAYRKEYAKKLYKLVAPEGNDALKYFSQYAAGNGKLSKDELKNFVKQTQLQRQIEKNPTGGQKYWWNVGRPGYEATVDVLASSKEEAIALGKKQYPEWDYAQDMTARPIGRHPASVDTKWMVTMPADPAYRTYVTAPSEMEAILMVRNSNNDLRWADLEATPYQPGSTRDLAQQRAAAATQNATNPLWRDELRNQVPAAAQPQGAFTGRWLFQNANTGEVVHTISGIGNSQADANRYAQSWVQQSGYDDPLEVVPEMGAPVSEGRDINEAASDYELHDREKLDQVLKKCCRMVIRGQQRNPEKYGQVAACVIDPENRQIFGINLPGANGTRRHAEHVALDRYRRDIGEVPQGSIIVTTCSPCNSPMDERAGESCKDLLNSVGIHKVYAGYEDPTQHDDRDADFRTYVTGRDDLWSQCQLFAQTFLNKEDPISEAGTSLDYIHGGNVVKQKVYQTMADAGYKKVGRGADASVWTKDAGSVMKIITSGQTPFLKFYKFCRAHPDNPHLPRFMPIQGQDHAVFKLYGAKFLQASMEKLQKIRSNSPQEFLIWYLEDAAGKNHSWDKVVTELTANQGSELWKHSNQFPMETLQTIYKSLNENPNRWLPLYKTIVALRKHTGSASWDLHTDNAMRRSDGTIVIIDPYTD